MLRAALLGTLGGLILAACSPFGGASVFNCDRNEQCTPGTCKLDEGLCVLPAPECMSGEKYGSNSGGKSGECVGGNSMVDAAIDAPSMCTPGQTYCFNHAVETCKSTGDGFDPALRNACALTCTTTGTPACLAATNIAAMDQAMCNASNNAPALMPTTGTVTINATDISCSAGCGGGNNTIARTSATPNNFYCLASINIPSGVNVSYAAGVTGGVTLFSSGAVVIAGTISFNGGNATGVANTNTTDDLPGAGGPGGFTGGAAVTNDTAGNPGGGPGGTMCGGRGGNPAETAAAGAGGGGGGGGNQGTGGTAGDSRSQNLLTGQGGNGGTNTNCSTADGRPTLVGGAGGGGGADGAGGAGVQCGWPGGGGGGALQIVSRSMISGAGAITANGGTGYGDATVAGGGGGGGAGGMILLEAPMVTFSGMLQVNGGNGGATDTNAGNGAATNTINGGNGTDAMAGLQGGPGGGGGGGRIRINANAAACPGTASPTASCTTGTLRSTP